MLILKRPNFIRPSQEFESDIKQTNLEYREKIHKIVWWEEKPIEYQQTIKKY